MNNNDFITVDADIMRGRPVFKGTRVPIDGLFEYLEAGLTIDSFSNDFPSVTRELAVNVLELLKSELVGI